jgi:hypothetical protein
MTNLPARLCLHVGSSCGERKSRPTCDALSQAAFASSIFFSPVPHHIPSSTAPTIVNFNESTPFVSIHPARATMTTDGQSLLQTCAVALVGQYGATIEFLRLYSSTLSNRLLNEPPFRQRHPISVVKYEAKDEWAKVARRFRNTPDWAARLK